MNVTCKWDIIRIRGFVIFEPYLAQLSVAEGTNVKGLKDNRKQAESLLQAIFVA